MDKQADQFVDRAPRALTFPQMSECQVAGIGAILGYDSNRRVVVTKMLPRGLAAAM